MCRFENANQEEIRLGQDWRARLGIVWAVGFGILYAAMVVRERAPGLYRLFTG